MKHFYRVYELNTCIQYIYYTYISNVNVANIFYFLVYNAITTTTKKGKTSKEFKSIQLRNNSLVVDFATDADEGYYMCQANNGIGSTLKKIIYINVNGKYRHNLH